MAKYGTVAAVRLPIDVERELKRRAKEDDRPLSAYLRRALTALTTVPPMLTERAPEKRDNTSPEPER